MDDAEVLPAPPTVRELELERLLHAREKDILTLKVCAHHDLSLLGVRQQLLILAPG